MISGESRSRVGWEKLKNDNIHNILFVCLICLSVCFFFWSTIEIRLNFFMAKSHIDEVRIQTFLSLSFFSLKTGSTVWHPDCKSNIKVEEKYRVSFSSTIHPIIHTPVTHPVGPLSSLSFIELSFYLHPQSSDRWYSVTTFPFFYKFPQNSVWCLSNDCFSVSWLVCFSEPGDMCVSVCVSVRQIVLSLLVLLCRKRGSDLAESPALLISFCPSLSVSLSVRRRAGVALLEACVPCAGRRFAVSCLPPLSCTTSS